MKRIRFDSPTIVDRVPLRFVAAVLVAASIGGCAGSGTSENFYALNDGGVVQSMTTSTTGLANQSAALPGIVISAVTVPELVDRPQIVTRDTANRVIVSEQNLWAEPVRAAIGRTLVTRLGRAMSDAGRPAQVAAYPQSSITNPYLRVTIDVVRFDAVPNGEAVIDALWSVRRSSDGAVRTGHTVASSPISGTSYDAIVRGWNEALREIDRDVAAMVEQISAADPSARSPAR